MSEADNDQPEAFCNFCGGRLELLVVNATNPFPYRCLRCEQVPSSVDRVEPPNLAESYMVNLDYRRKSK